MPHPYLEGAASPRILAHRGLVVPSLPEQHGSAEQGIAENTRAAFAAAAEAGAEYLETDCHLTRDREVVLFHDADLGRITGDKRPISAATRRELDSLMRGRGGLLTLEELLHEFPQARLNIDVKAAAAAEPVGRIVAAHAHRALVTSFSDAYRIRALRAAATSEAEPPATSPGRSSLIRVLLAIATNSRARITRAFAGLDALQIPERQGPIRVLSRRLIDEAHHRGVEVHVWTVNDPRRMTELVGLGVDGIVTDRSDIAIDTFYR